MVVKRSDGWYVVSATHKDKEGKPKNLGGPYASEAEAQARLAQVESCKKQHSVDDDVVADVHKDYGDAAGHPFRGNQWKGGEGGGGDMTKEHLDKVVAAFRQTGKARDASSAAFHSGSARDHEIAALEHENAERMHTGLMTALGRKQAREHTDMAAKHRNQENLARERGMFADEGREVHTFDAEIFSTGKWNGDDYTHDDLDNMVENFERLREEIKPPVKLGHNTDGINKGIRSSDGQPALGWVDKLRRVGDKLIATFSGVPDALHKALKAGRYRRVSSEIYWNYKSRHNGGIYRRVLDAVALLGADIPAVTNLADLQALMARSTGAGAPGSFEAVKTYTARLDDGEADVQYRIGYDTNEGGGDIMLTEAEIKALQDKAARADALEAEKKLLSDAQREKDAKLAKLEEENKTYVQKEEQRAKDEAEKKRTDSKAAIVAFCDAKVKEFTMLPAARDIIVKSLDEGKHAYSAEAGFTIDAETFRAFMDTQAKGGKLVQTEKRGSVQEPPVGEDEADRPGMKLHTLTVKYAEEKKVDYITAQRAVLRDNKDLAAAYLDSTPVKHGDDDKGGDE